MSAPVFIPDSWKAHIDPVSAHSVVWAAAGRLARADARTAKTELAPLLDLVDTLDPALKGADGTPLLVHLLSNWDEHFADDYGGDDPWWSIHALSGATPSRAQLPLPGEPAWDGAGAVEPWELPAALLIARGADPFERGPDGRSGFGMAIQVNAMALLTLMLRHPRCPPPAHWPSVQAPSERDNRAVLAPPLVAAVGHHPKAGAFSLLVAHADAHALMARDIEGNTALHHAVRCDRSSMTRELLALATRFHVEPWWTENHTGRLPVEAFHATHLDRPVRLCWSLMEQDPSPLRRARARAAAAYLGMPLAEWPSSAALLTDERAPGGASLLEWALTGNLARRCSTGRCEQDTLVELLRAASWPPETREEAQWLLPSSEEGRSVEALGRLKTRALALGYDPDDWVLILAELVQSPKTLLSPGVWAFCVGTMGKCVEAAVAKKSEASAGFVNPSPLAAPVLACLENVPPPSTETALAACIYALSMTLRLNRAARAPAQWPLPEPGWSTTLEGQRVCRLWPHIRAQFYPEERAHVERLLEAETHALALPQPPAPARPRL